jgi:hypothetical protein
MLQALKVNDSKPRFYTEYLKFEVIFLDKLMQRRKVLNGAHQKKPDLNFVEGDEDAQEVEGEIKPGEESNIVKIVVKSLLEKFPTNILVLREVIKILGTSQYVDRAISLQIKETYNHLKNESS